MEPHQTKEFFHKKGNHQQNEKQPIVQQNIFNNDTSDKGLISKIYKELAKLNTHIHKHQTI